MNNFVTEILTAKVGHTHIFSTGQAGFIIKSSSGQIVGVDLYLSDCDERIEGHAGFKRLLPKIFSPSEIEFDAVICTHAHFDHFDFDSVPEFLANGRTKLFCSEGCKNLTERLFMSYHEKQIRYVKPGDVATVGDFQINFVNCDHGTAAPDAVGVVSSVDGKIIYEAGDTRLRTDRVNEIPERPDVLIAPITGRSAT